MRNRKKKQAPPFRTTRDGFAPLGTSRPPATLSQISRCSSLQDSAATLSPERWRKPEQPSWPPGIGFDDPTSSTDPRSFQSVVALGRASALLPKGWWRESTILPPMTACVASHSHSRTLSAIPSSERREIMWQPISQAYRGPAVEEVKDWDRRIGNRDPPAWTWAPPTQVTNEHGVAATAPGTALVDVPILPTAFSSRVSPRGRHPVAVEKKSLAEPPTPPLSCLRRARPLHARGEGRGN